VGSGPEGFGLWVGRFVRRRLCASSGCDFAILAAIVNSVFNSILVAQEHYHKEKHCHKKEEQLVCHNAGEA
jgi:hypothetical protein